MEEKKLVMETLGKEVKEKCEENGIEYLLAMSDGVNKCTVYSAAKDLVLKEIIDLACKLVPGKK